MKVSPITTSSIYVAPYSLVNYFSSHVNFNCDFSTFLSHILKITSRSLSDSSIVIFISWISRVILYKPTKIIKRVLNTTALKPRNFPEGDAPRAPWMLVLLQSTNLLPLPSLAYSILCLCPSPLGILSNETLVMNSPKHVLTVVTHFKPCSSWSKYMLQLRKSCKRNIFSDLDVGIARHFLADNLKLQ